MRRWQEREAEGRHIANSVAAQLQQRPLPALATSFVGKVETWTETGPSGVIYSVEVYAAWDSGQPDVLRVTVCVYEESPSIGEGRWRWQRLFGSTFCPVTTDFLVRPNR